MLIVLLISLTWCATCSGSYQGYLLSYPAAQADDDWWYDQGHDWDTSDYFNSYNPFYQTFKQVKAQLDMYGYAKHVGKINRGQFLNPELIQPVHRAFGYQSDFDLKDVNSGAFRYKPKGQKFRAKTVHVNAGLASKVGEITTMPVGQYVQKDGSVLIQTSNKQSNPCSPNPCTNNNFPMCEVVLDGTAKCSRSETYTMTLTWEDPVDDDSLGNELRLIIVSVKHDGNACDFDDDHTHKNRYEHTSHGSVASIHDDHSECGVNMEQPYHEAYNDNGDDTIGKDVAIFETLQDGTNWEDYTHQILVIDNYNLIEGFPVLTITDVNGKVVQELQIPQYDGLVEVNPGIFFFGCFRNGFVDTRGAGFYGFNHMDPYVLNTGLLPLLDAGLCNALYHSSLQPGFNPEH